MTFDNLADLITYINTTFTANGVRDISGPEAHDALIGIIDLIGPTLVNQLIVNAGGGGVGGAINGTTFAEGATIESILRSILIQAIPPTYTQPVEALSTNVATLNYEVGSIISPTLSSIFTQNDAGALQAETLQKNGDQISESLPYEDSSLGLTLTPVVYQAAATYAQGACKNDSLGNQSCGSRVTAGTISSNTITYRGYRNLFYGVPDIDLITSDNVREALEFVVLNPHVGIQFTINVPTTTTRVAFAYPATIEDVDSIVYREMGSQVKGIFTQTLVNVQGANGYAAVSYKVYIFEPIEPFQNSATFDITL